MAERKEELRSLLMKVKDVGGKAGLKLHIHKTKIVASGLITSRQIDGRGKVEAVTDLTFLGSKITVGGEIKRCLFLGRKATTNLDILKSRDNTLPTKVSIIKALPPSHHHHHHHHIRASR